MQLRLRTKLTLIMTGLVLLVVAVLSAVFVAQLFEQVLQQTDKRTVEIANQVFEQARRALTEAAARGLRPASNDPNDINEYVQKAFRMSEGLRAQLKAAKVDTPAIYEVSITNNDGKVLISTDESLAGKFLPRRTKISQLTQRGYLHQAKVLAGPPQVYELDLPFTNGDQPFGEVRVMVSSGLLLNDISSSVRQFGTISLLALVISTVLAAVVSRATLAPLSDISAQLDRISAGQYDTPAGDAKGFTAGTDELGQVSRKITQVGQQLRGVHEIFSTLRENMDSVMAGLEDGLLLFTRDARAVMVSPAAEKFLGAPAGHFLGRRVNEIFPLGHPLHAVLHVEGDELSEIAAETDLDTIEGTRRVSVSVQAIQENGERMGALVTLRDLDSIESINTQLQVSERLAALGRITAGVAHEVKNPLNSMRLWLENLKESLPPEPDSGSQQAVQVLDKEIDRLDAVVKRFLDFTRPMEVRLEATQIADVLKDVVEIAKPQLQKAKIHVAQLLPIDVPEVYVDRALLKQAVLNLVLNAVEAMPSGGQLRLMLSRRGEMAEITVGDTGKGIPLENRQKIFQLFFTTRPGGSGIGLASTFRIVQLHNGSIDFTSEVGRGTTFRIELPLAA
ncbi:MAG: multi-sensor signal transduction histidine kinase [Candidatus Acidoferrum typicum]|nr:multi-sensor signal transduction histidine kinase [Candidatus Acidoferrum typicum]